ncbi:MAG: hypothetical protein Q8Q56_05525 [Alphaproteobacteria bacterium]|nr:hypothetical protein [Alphaproteobacteria bacterium]
MRFLFVVGLVLSALSFESKTYGAEGMSMISTLNKEFGGSFFVDNKDPSKIKLKSESGDIIVWWYVNHEKAFEVEGLMLLKSRYDNFGQGKSVYHLMIEGQAYKVHLSQESALLKAHPEAPEAHIALIKAWLATFEGQPS